MRRKKKKKSLIERIENKKIFGFTLIELLAVIIILGVLMIIAIPSVTEYIQTSRKNSFIVTAQSFIDGATTKVNSMEYDVMDVDATYYLPTKCISFEKGGESPFGEFEESYVVVTYDGKGYDYYYTGRDSSNHGIVLTYRELLDESYIETNTKTLDLNVTIGNREKIIRYNDDCNKSSYEELIPTQRIEEESTLKNGSTKINTATEPSCFDFNASTGTITRYNCASGLDPNTFKMLDVDGCVEVFIDEGMTNLEAKNYCENELGNSITRENVNDYWLDELISKNIISLDGYSDEYRNVVIPKQIDGIPVTKIGEYAFDDTYIYTIVLHENITEIGYRAFNNTGLLYNIVNKTGREFNWNQIIFETGENQTFATGEFEYFVDLSRYEHNGFVLTNTVAIHKKITDRKVDYSFDGMFKSDQYEFKLLNKKGYKIYAYDRDTQSYLSNEVGDMIYTSGYCCARHSDFVVLDDDEIIYAGRYTFHIPWCAC